MPDDTGPWPPEDDRDADVDPMWLPPLDGQTPFEYLEARTDARHQDVAAILSEYEFGESDDFPDGRKYDANAMLHAYVYREVLGEFDSWYTLESHLNSSPKVAQYLGFGDDTPNWDTLRRYWQNLDDDQQEFLTDEAAPHFRNKVFQEFAEAGHPDRVVFDDYTPDPDEISIEEKKEAVRHIRGMVNDILDFGRDHTSKYDRELLLDLQATVSRSGESIDSVLNHLHDESDADLPKTSGFFWNLKKRSSEEWNELFEEIFTTQIKSAKGAGFLDPEDETWQPDDFVDEGKFDAYIDATVLPYYQNKKGEKPEGVTGGSKTAGTHYGFTFCTISTHADNRSFNLASMPYKDETDYEDAVAYLLDRALEYIDVDVVCIDSEYSGVEVLKLLEDRDQDFIIQYPKYEGIKKKVALMDERFDQTPHVVDPDLKPIKTGELTLLAEPNYDQNPPRNWNWGYEPSKSEIAQIQFDDYDDGVSEETPDLDGKSLNDIAQLLDLDDIPKEHHEYRRAYLTNIDVGEDEVKETVERYNKRWRIETKYRVVKHEFTPKTRTQFLSARNFFWLFSCALYNAWVLLDVFVRSDNPEIDHGERPQLTANRFGKYFLGDGTDDD